MSTAVSLTGGAGSIAVEFEELQRLGVLLDTAAETWAHAAYEIVRGAVHSERLSSDVLDPAGAVEVIGLVSTCSLALTAIAAEATVIAASLRAAHQCYLTADDLRASYTPLFDALIALPAALREAATLIVRVDFGQLEAIVVADPYLADAELFALSAAATGPFPLLGRDEVPLLAARLADLYRDGEPVLSRPVAPVTNDESGPPRSITDLIQGVALRTSDDDGGGRIDIRFVTRDGRRSVIVDLPGTSRWNLDPLTNTPQVTDFSSNLAGISGQETVYERGVIEALTAAGVRPDEPIMLVGHSEGGIIAANLAVHLAQSKQFDVTHIVTAGAPIGAEHIPSSVSVLAIENRHDLVPQLDGRENPDRSNWITATVDEGTDQTIAGRHLLPAYVAGARDLDADEDLTMNTWKLGAADFLDGDDVQTEVYQIRRR
jgi:hypothetical protein